MARRPRRRPIEPVRSLPRHPYRDAAILHGGLAVLIVIVAWLVGSDLQQAGMVAVGYSVAATSWSWLRFRQRARRPAASEERP